MNAQSHPQHRSSRRRDRLLSLLHGVVEQFRSRVFLSGSKNLAKPERTRGVSERPTGTRLGEERRETDLVRKVDTSVDLPTPDELDDHPQHLVLLHPERDAHPRQLDRLEGREVLDESATTDRSGEVGEVRGKMGGEEVARLRKGRKRARTMSAEA